MSGRASQIGCKDPTIEPMDDEVPEVVEEAEAGQEDEAAAPPAPAPHPVPRARVRPAPRPVTPTQKQRDHPPALRALVQTLCACQEPE